MLSKVIGAERSSNTPTTLPPPPRQVREDPRYASAQRPKRIFVAVAAGTALLYVLMTAWGAQTLRTLNTVQGRAVGGWTAQGIKGTTHILAFEYPLDGQLRSGTDVVDKGTYNRFVGPGGKVIPGPIEVHVSHVGPIYSALIRRNETPQLMWVAGALCLACLPWIPYAIWYLWLAPAQKRRICATGITAPCTVTERRERKKHRQAIYDLAYEFAVGSKSISGKYSTDPGAWGRGSVPDACLSVRTGDTLTAIYLQDKPARHLVYELSGLVVDQVQEVPHG